MSGIEGAPAELTVIIVSYNTRELTLRAVETLLENAGDTSVHVIVWDNGSVDGSAAAIRARFPGVETIAHPDNLGFAEANNRAAALTASPWLLLLNPDTETLPGAVEQLRRFAIAHPEAGIVGGQTLFPDGSLNPASCRNRMTLWSLACAASGLARLFAASRLFNPEEIGGWRRDEARQVDIVVGCFLMISRSLWNELGGFRSKYFMYGEEADLCLRAARRGYRPMITPAARIVHLVGAASGPHQDKIVLVLRARAALIGDHWHPLLRPAGRALLWLWAANRVLADRLIGLVAPDPHRRKCWTHVWAQRRQWLSGY